APLSSHTPLSSRRRHNVPCYVAASEIPTNPDIIHVKCSPWSLGIIPQRFIEEPRLDQITSTASDHRHALRLAELAAVDHGGVAPIKSSRHCCAADTNCGIGHLRVVMQIRCECISRINSIVVQHHYQGISAAGRKLLSNCLDKLSGWTPVPATMPNTDTRQPREIFRHDIRPLLANGKFGNRNDDFIRRACLPQKRPNRWPQIVDSARQSRK